MADNANKANNTGKPAEANKNPARKQVRAGKGKPQGKPQGKPFSGKDCKFGADCTRKDCKFDHPKDAKTATTKPPTPDVFVSYVIDDSQKGYLKENFPNLHIGMSRNATKHSHPLHAIERKLAEEEAVNLIGPHHSTLDIGGNPIRHALADRWWVFSCCPILDSTDAFREEERKKRAVELENSGKTTIKVSKMWCNHKVQDCSCISPLAYLSVHSIYYLSPGDVLNLVNRRGVAGKSLGLVAVMHDFSKGTNGTFCQGESYWEKSGDTVTMHVAGNLSPYKHSAADWVFKEGGYYDRCGVAMSWSLVRSMGSCVIVKFVKAPSGLRKADVLPTLALSQALVSDQAANVDLRGVLSKGDKIVPASLDVQKLTIDRVVSVRDWIKITRPGSTEVLIPKGLINAAAFWITGKPRDSSNYTLLVNQMKREVVKYNVPPDVMVDAVIWASSIGFTMKIDAEIAAHATVYESSHFRSRLLNQLIRFDYYGVTSWKALLYIGAFAASLVSLFLTFRILRSGAIRRMFGFRNHHLMLLATSSKGDSLRAIYSIFMARLRVVLGYVGTKLRAIVQPFTVHVPGIWTLGMAPFAFADVCVKDKSELTPMYNKAKVKVLGEDHCVPKFGILNCGPVPAEFTSVMPRSCIHNELVAVVNRACINRPNSEPGMWASIKWSKIFNEDDVRTFAPVKAVNFEDWVSRFPKSRRGMLRVAHMKLKEGDFSVQKYHINKSFVKKEHTLKFDNDDLIPFDPRLIQGYGDVYQVQTGPITLALSKWLVKCWTLDTNRRKFIVYTAGMNAHQIGKVVADAIAYLGGDPEADEDDCSRWDAHIDEEAHKAKHHVYFKVAKVSKKYRKPMEKQHETKGATPHGIKYENDETVKSGSGDTSMGNSTQNGGAHYDTYLEVGIREGDFIIFVLGDDILVLVRRCIEYRDRKPKLEARLRRFGLSVKLQTYDSIHLAEFCSGRFWPSNEGYTFGPKIGRSLVKMYRCIHNVSDWRKWAGEVTYANSLDHAHVPILRAVNQAMMSQHKGLLRPKEVDDHKIHASYKVAVVSETWTMMDRLYGVSESTIMEIEGWILANFTQPVLAYNHPVINKIIRTDIFERYGTITIGMKSTLTYISDMFNLQWVINKVIARHTIPTTIPEMLEPSYVATELLEAVVIAPPLEEAVKRVTGWLAFAIFENALYFVRMLPLADTMGLRTMIISWALVRTPPTIMHWAASKCKSWGRSTLLHGTYNLIAILNSVWIRYALLRSGQIETIPLPKPKVSDPLTDCWEP